MNKPLAIAAALVALGLAGTVAQAQSSPAARAPAVQRAAKNTKQPVNPGSTIVNDKNTGAVIESLRGVNAQTNVDHPGTSCVATLGVQPLGNHPGQFTSTTGSTTQSIVQAPITTDTQDYLGQARAATERQQFAQACGRAP